LNILISCAGGPAAVGIIKSVAEFNDSTHKVVAIDCDELSVGFHLADKSYVVPFSVEDDFFDVGSFSEFFNIFFILFLSSDWPFFSCEFGSGISL